MYEKADDERLSIHSPTKRKELTCAAILDSGQTSRQPDFYASRN